MKLWEVEGMIIPEHTIRESPAFKEVPEKFQFEKPEFEVTIPSNGMVMKFRRASEQKEEEYKREYREMTVGW